MAKITEDELKEVNDLRYRLSTVINEVGQTTLQLELLKDQTIDLENRVTEGKKTFQLLLEEEQKLVNRLSEQYGVGSINFETGEFTPEN